MLPHFHCIASLSFASHHKTNQSSSDSTACCLTPRIHFFPRPPPRCSLLSSDSFVSFTARLVLHKAAPIFIFFPILLPSNTSIHHQTPSTTSANYRAIIIIIAIVIIYSLKPLEHSKLVPPLSLCHPSDNYLTPFT